MGIQPQLDEQEFRLEDKDVQLVSPCRIKLRSKRKRRDCRSRSNLKKHVLRCSNCNFIFDSISILKSHKKVCGMKLEEPEKEEYPPANDSTSHVDFFLLDLLKADTNSEIIKEILKEYSKVIGEPNNDADSV